MRILYVILTCGKHLPTRVKWQKNTWIKRVDIGDVIFLYNPVGKETYLNVPKKYMVFFKYTEFELFDKYDWVFFCDDDTFVFPEKLKSLLIGYNEKPKMVGYRLGAFKIEGTELMTTCCSGGAGFALNKSLFIGIKKYNEYPLTNESDTSIAIWCALACPDFEVIDKSDVFRTHNPRHQENQNLKIEGCITYHYCTVEDFNNLNEYL